MSLWFALSLFGFLVMVPIHFLSVEHGRLESRFGEINGKKVGTLLGMLSGWGIFLFYFGLWFSPQPGFCIPLFGLKLNLQLIEIPLLHLVSGLISVMIGSYLGLRGVLDMGLEVAETHRPNHVISTGLYAKSRHPQYLGAMLSHLGMTFLLSSWYSLLATPLIVAVNYALCWKEEKEMAREFGEEYDSYRDSVPMFFSL